ncbi:MAG TPA: adenylate/guanylate cyclase domain-containing protein [Armatimonadota bacterium]|jgi:class 3 adenylate cyclase
MRLRKKGQLKIPGLPIERRYTTEETQRIINLAQEVEQFRGDTITADEVVEVGQRLNLDPAVLRELLARTGPAPRRSAPSDKVLRLRQRMLSLTLPFGVGLLAYLLRSEETVLVALSVIGLLPISAMLGYLAGREDTGEQAASVLVLALAPALGPLCVLHAPIAILPARWAGRKGAEIRREHDEELAGGGQVSRLELLDQLYSLERRLEGEKLYRVFLSVDVVGSSHAAQSGPELAVEYTFGQFRLWVEESLKEFGGRVQSSAGDGVMCLFEEDVAAIRAARRLLTGIEEFNRARNRLDAPLRIRCGISAGEVALEPGVNLRDVQSPAIYRAAVMQKMAQPDDLVISQEVAGAAVWELDGLSPCQEEGGTPTAYAWRRAQGTQ